jgi:hypothetical protein
LENYLLNYVGVEKLNYFHFLDSLTFRALRDRLFVDKDGNIFSKALVEYETETEKYKMLQYDNLFGNQYINR